MLYYLQRNLETGEEPDCIALWELTHKKNGAWPNKESQEVYVSKINSTYFSSSLMLCILDASSSDGIVLVVYRTKHVKLFKTKKMKLKLQFQVNKEAIFSRLHIRTL
jgi:hypothetical protein